MKLLSMVYVLYAISFLCLSAQCMAAEEHKAAAKADYIARVRASLTNHKLIVAALVGDTAEVRSLVAERADVNTIHCDGDNVSTPLIHAAKGNHPEVIDVLLANNANPDMNVVPNGATALLVACSEGNNAAAESLLAAQACPNQADLMGGTPLMTTAMTGNSFLAGKLLDARADTAKKLKNKNVGALEVAEKFGHSAVIELLKKAGAQPASSHDGTTDQNNT